MLPTPKVLPLRVREPRLLSHLMTSLTPSAPECGSQKSLRIVNAQSRIHPDLNLTCTRTVMMRKIPRIIRQQREQKAIVP
jgi:hypothetical protein